MGRNRNNNSQQCTYYDDDLLFQLGYYTGGNLSWFCCPTRSLVNRIWAGTFRTLYILLVYKYIPCLEGITYSIYLLVSFVWIYLRTYNKYYWFVVYHDSVILSVCHISFGVITLRSLTWQFEILGELHPESHRTGSLVLELGAEIGPMMTPESVVVKRNSCFAFRNLTCRWHSQ